MSKFVVPFMALAAAFTAFAATAAAQPKEKLNVLVIMGDDLNDDLGTYGHPVVKTPHLDRLAAMGVRFDRADVQYPLCNPSRTSMLSGKRPDTTGVFGNGEPQRSHIGMVRFMPEHFRDNGYYTMSVGKSSHQRFTDEVDWHVSILPSEDFGPYTETFYWGSSGQAEEASVDGVVARKAGELLAQNRDKTFFMIAGFRKPHLPFMCPSKYIDMYPPASIELPVQRGEPANDRADIPRAALPPPARPNWPSFSDAQKRQVIASYYACNTFIDAQVGYLLDKLAELDLLENTIVVFVSDHGFHLNEHGGLFDKFSLFEESVRVPLIVAAPGKARGAVATGLVEVVDLYPTLAELAGLPKPAGMEGLSFAPLLDDPKRPWKKAAFAQVQSNGLTGRRVRGERYRYTEWGGPGEAELYDLENDPGEWKNLVGDPAHAKALTEMRDLLKGGWRMALPGAYEPPPVVDGPASVPEPSPSADGGSPPEDAPPITAGADAARSSPPPLPSDGSSGGPAPSEGPRAASSSNGCGCQVGSAQRSVSEGLTALALLGFLAWGILGRRLNRP